MSGDLRELYQQLVFDHYKHPRNHHPLGTSTHHADGHNPLCGDEVTVYIDVADGIVRDVAFEGGGCAIATASASLMTEAIKGRPVAEVEKLFGAFHRMVTGTAGPDAAPLGKLEVLAGVREFPVRVKCATLAWHTLHAALAGGTDSVSTE